MNRTLRDGAFCHTDFESVSQFRFAHKGEPAL